MKKKAYIASLDIADWPHPEEIEDCFLTREGQQWLFESQNETGGLTAEGVDGTEHLLPDKGRIDIILALAMHPTMGVQLCWEKGSVYDGQVFHSKGDLGRLREYVVNTYGTPLSVGLMVPFEVAWKAIKEFIETDGQRPKSIEWINSLDTPPEAFPDPGDPIVAAGLVRE